MSRVNNHQSKSGRIMRENGDWINEADYMDRNMTPLNEHKTVEKSQQIIYSSNVPISNRRDELVETNGGTVTHLTASAEYRVRASTTTNSKAALQTKQRGNYLPGNVHEAGMGIRIPVQPTGDAYIKWGYYKDDTGIYCLYDATGLYFVVENGGVENLKVLQANWNQNNLTGLLDLSNGNIFQFPFVYYGYGPAYLEIGLKESARFNKYESYNLEVAHSFNMDGATTFSEPNLPITIEVDSGTTGVQLDAFVGGRQITTYGRVEPTRRLIGDIRNGLGSIDETFLPMVSFRHRTGYENISLRLQNIEVISDADLIYRIIREPTLTGASFGTATGFTTAETASEWDISATAVSGGDVIKTGLISGQNKDRLTKTDLPSRILNEGDIYTLAVRRRSGTNATATGFIEISEAW